MPVQLAKNVEDTRRLVRTIDSLLYELDLLIMKEPTGYPREEMTSANILIIEAKNHLLEIV